MLTYEVATDHEAWDKPKTIRLKALGLLAAWPVLMISVPIRDAIKHGGGLQTVVESWAEGFEALGRWAGFAFLPWGVADG